MITNITDWRGPSGGATVDELRRRLGLEAIGDQRRTNLHILREGNFSHYDKERARVALTEMRERKEA